jgi:hypothetical protein
MRFSFITSNVLNMDRDNERQKAKVNGVDVAKARTSEYQVVEIRDDQMLSTEQKSPEQRHTHRHKDSDKRSLLYTGCCICMPMIIYYIFSCGDFYIFPSLTWTNRGKCHTVCCSIEFELYQLPYCIPCCCLFLEVCGWMRICCCTWVCIGNENLCSQLLMECFPDIRNHRETMREPFIGL